MKKKLRIILITLGSFVLIYGFLSQFGFLILYNNPTTANEPNISFNSRTIVSNLVDAKNGDFVCYRFKDTVLGNHIRVHRLCASENDTIQIIKGNVIVNGKDYDKDLNLIFLHLINSDDFELLKKDNKINDNTIGPRINEDAFLVGIDKQTAKKYKLSEKRFTGEKLDSTFSFMFKSFLINNNSNNNLDPLIIPENKIFVIGDNRDNSEDSRYFGLLDKDDIVGVVLNK